MNHLWFLEEQRVLPLLRLHLPHHLLYHRSPKSVNRDSVSDNRGVETPESERIGGTSEELRGPAAETENQNKKEESKEVQGDISHELPDWLQEFRENLVDESA